MEMKSWNGQPMCPVKILILQKKVEWILEAISSLYHNGASQSLKRNSEVGIIMPILLTNILRFREMKQLA